MSTSRFPVEPGVAAAADAPADHGPARALLMRPGPESSLAELLRFTARLLRVPIAYVSVQDGHDERIKWALGREPAPPPVPAAASALARPLHCAVASGETFALDDATGDPHMAAAGWGAVLAAPLIVRDVPFGCLAVADTQPRTWLPRELTALAELTELLLGSATEVGGRRAVTRALEHSELRYRALIQHSGEGMWCCEFAEPISVELPSEQQIDRAYEHSMLVECNDALATMYGHASATDMLGAPLALIVPREDPTNVEMLARLIDSGYRLADIETHEVDPNGGTRHFLNTMIGVVENGHVVRVWGTQQDITERRRLEEQLRQAQKMEAVGRLAGGVAHDFNNLLTAIQGHAALALAGAASGEDVAEDLQEIQRAAERATSLTRQLLAFSRKQVLHPRVLDLNAIVASMERMLRRLIGEHIELTTHFRLALGCVRADAGQLEQVILNLAVNARDAMPDGGRLVIETGEVYLGERLGERYGVAPGKYARLAVRDTGVGMDRETLTHVFEPFFTTKASGTGLGLATVYGIVEQSGGHITAYSEPGHGTVFKVHLPIVAAALPQALPVSPEPIETVTAGGGETILLVEDEAGVRAVARKTLRIKGYRVIEAASGPEAIELARQCGGAIHLLLTDVVMPGMSGTQLATVLARELPGLRVAYMSGYTDDEVFRAGAPLGHAAFIEKPFTPGHLAGCVRRILDGRAVEPEPQRAVAGLA